MGKVKQWSVEKKDQIERILIRLWSEMGMDVPQNFEAIVQYVYEDVCETADPVNWSDGDVTIGFRRWIEEQNIPKKNGTRPNYFHINAQGWNKGLEREEVQVHCGENGNLFLIKTEEGFIIDMYDVGGNNIHTATIWEDDINPLTDDDEDNEPIDPNNFSLVEQEDFLDKWGQLTDEVCAELGYDEETSDDLLMVDYFYYEPKKYWIPKISSLYTPREQSIADYLKLG
jgi:hypothetical protein